MRTAKAKMFDAFGNVVKTGMLAVLIRGKDAGSVLIVRALIRDTVRGKCAMLSVCDNGTRPKLSPGRAPGTRVLTSEDFVVASRCKLVAEMKTVGSGAAADKHNLR
jgi:hypothetical protein